MRKILFVLLPLLVWACRNQEKKPSVTPTEITSAAVDSFLVTDSSWGLIREHSNIDELKKIFGTENILDVRECDAECIDSVDVTKVYPGGENEITIRWKDSAYHREIGVIECFGEHPRWHSAEGIKIGSGLKELARVNGKKISFYGFGWDYGGLVESYNGGALDKSEIGYRLNLDIDYAGDRSIYGEVGLDTEMPAVQKALDSIRVWWITLSFYKPPAE